MEGKELKRTSKFLSMEDAEKQEAENQLTQNKGVVAMKQPEKNLEDIPDYEAKLAKYYKYQELYAKINDIYEKPLQFYYPEPAAVEKDNINRFFGVEVASVLPTKLGLRDSYKIILNTELMKNTFTDIIGPDKAILASRKNIAA